MGDYEIRTMYPDAFRFAVWAKLIGRTEVEGQERYVVVFPDGEAETWPVDDPDGRYEFR